jgi:transcriptional regulator with XRE-family HTH domain
MAMADLQETMGLVLRRERRERKLTLKELAERSALSVVYLGEVERGKKYPSASVLERLSAALDLEVADLLELVADELRGPREQVVNAIGYAVPGATTPRITVRRIVNLLEPDEVTTIAELSAFFIARRTIGFLP